MTGTKTGTAKSSSSRSKERLHSGGRGGMDSAAKRGELPAIYDRVVKLHERRRLESEPFISGLHIHNQ